VQDDEQPDITSLLPKSDGSRESGEVGVLWFRALATGVGDREAADLVRKKLQRGCRKRRQGEQRPITQARP
jgi:hypothetical protein